jgi:hypothetical protein
LKAKDARDFFFRGLLFEAESDTFRRAGIQIGIDSTRQHETLLEATLAPFSIDRRNQALEMGRLYSLLFCFENEVRDFIRDVLEDNDGIDWIEKLPPQAKKFAQSRMDEASKNTWLEGQKTDLLSYLDFGSLSSLIIEKWEYFKGFLPSQHWLKQRMDEIEKSRNFIAHNRMLLPSEFDRLYMYISDWNRQIGL